MTELTKIANKYLTDKGTAHPVAHGYTEFYDEFFKEKRKITILEVGVDKGASIKMLQEYFGENTEIYGIDIDDKSEYEEEHIHMIQADQGSRDALSSFKEKYSNIKFDIIIDDGSHVPEHQILTLSFLHDMLKEDGIYILEDLHSNVAYCYSDIYKETPLFFLTFLEPSKFLTKEENDELISSIKKVQIYSDFNDKDAYQSGVKNRSITSVITFKHA